VPQREPRPWKVVSKEWLVDHPWLSAVEEVVETEGGTRLRWVRYADEREGRVRPLVASAIPMDADGRVLVARQWNHAPQRILHEFPGGGGEPGETAEDAIRRELREEVDLRAGRLEHLGAYVTNMRRHGMRIEVFLATELTHDPLPNDDAEAIAWDWLTPAEVDARIADGTFDSASILSSWALFRARHPRP
jgi:ADP-ribose pyrophosphatase